MDSYNVHIKHIKGHKFYFTLYFIVFYIILYNFN